MTFQLRKRAEKFSPEAGLLVQHLLGCSWGHTVRTDDDPEPCPEQAVGIAVIHSGDYETALKLCARHTERVLAETTPRKA